MLVFGSPVNRHMSTNSASAVPTAPNHASTLDAGRAPSVGLEHFSTKRAYAATFGAMLAIRIAGVLTGVLSARLLGPTGRGELAVIIFLPVLLVPIAEIELPRSIAYSVSKKEETPGDLAATSFWLAILLGAIQAIILMLAVPFFLSPGNLYLLGTAKWFAIYLPAIYILLFLNGIDQGRGALGRFALFQVLPGVIYLTAVLFSWWVGAISPAAFALGVLSGAVIPAAVRILLDWRSIMCTKPSWRIARRLLTRGVIFYIPAVAGFLLMRADTFLLVRLTTAKAIGLYAVAQAIALGQIGAVMPFIQVGFTAVAREADPVRALQTLGHHFRFAQFAVLSVGLLTAALTPWAIPLVFGPQFGEASAATYLLILASVFWGLGQVLEQGLRAAGYPRPGIVSNGLGLVVLFGLGIPACLRWGIAGIAASLALAECVNLAVLVTFCVVKLKLPFRFFWAFEPTTVREATSLTRLLSDRLSSRQWWFLTSGRQ
jgi:O-antigen/teichoic acid export membrane protein